MGYSKPNRYPWPAAVLADPCTSRALTVFPLLGGNGGADYMLLADAVAKGLARVTEESDSGTVPVIVIENSGKLPLLGIQGEEYVGAKQNRTLNITVLAAPGKTRIPVTCVEQGRWHYEGAEFHTGAYEHFELRTLKAHMVGKSRKARGPHMAKFAADQGMVWDAVSRESARHGAHSATGALHDVYRSTKVSGGLDAAIKGIEVPADTRGVVVAIGGEIVGADLFESPEVFERIWPRILRSYALSSLGRKAASRPSLEAAESFFKKPLDANWNATPSVGLGDDVRWEGKDFLASALVWEERFLHASVFAREDSWEDVETDDGPGGPVR